MAGGSDVGSVQINLRLALKDFNEDVSKGKKASREGAKDMADAFKGGAQEAKGALELLGDQIGVKIPRELRTLLVEIPGVGEALGAAFSSVAVVALISVLVEAYAKLQEYRKKVEEAAKAWTEFKDQGAVALRTLGEELLDLQKQIAVLKGNYVEALRLQIQQIDEISLDRIRKEFDALGKTAQDSLAKLAVGGFATFFGQGNDAAVENAKKDLEEILSKVHELQIANDNAGIGKLLDSKIADLKSFVNVPFANDDHPEVRQQALQKELDTLTLLRSVYEKVNETSEDKKKVAVLTDQARALKDVETEATRLYNMYVELQKQTDTVLAKNLTEYDQEIQKIDQLITRWSNYKTEWEAAHNGISALANEQLEKLQAEISVLNEEAQAAVHLALTAAINASKQAQDIKGLSNVSTSDKPVYGGTAEAAKLYELQTNANASVAAGQQVFTATRTAAEQYKQTLAELDILLKSGDIDQETYNRAKAAASVSSQEFRTLGADIGSTIEQATLFGRSWSDALKSIGVQIAELVLKLTLLKTAQSAPASGIGGFFQSLAGGLTSGGGHAAGGPVRAGVSYDVGERGREKFIPSVPGVIVPHGGWDNGGGTSIQVVQNITTPDANSFGKSQSQILADAYRQAAVSHGRNRGR